MALQAVSELGRFDSEPQRLHSLIVARWRQPESILREIKRPTSELSGQEKISWF